MHLHTKIYCGPHCSVSGKKKTKALFNNCYAIFKNLCSSRSTTTKSELMKGAKEVWSEIKISNIRRIIKAWPFRVDLIVEKLGFQIEHFSQ